MQLLVYAKNDPLAVFTSKIISNLLSIILFDIQESEYHGHPLKRYKVR